VQFLVSYSTDADLKGGPGRFGRFLIGKEPPKKTIAKPHGIALREGKIFVCDTSGRCLVTMDLNKKRMDIVIPDGAGLLRSPISIAVDGDGKRYVADSARGQVIIYDRDGHYVTAIGEKDEMRPTGIVIDKDRLYIADLKNNRIRVYEKSSRKLAFEITKEKTGTNQLAAPTSLALDKQGRLYVSQMTVGQVQVYDAEGKYLRTVGQLGDRPGELARPKGVAVDREDRLYVVDAASQVVQIFNSEGRVLMDFGGAKPPAGALDLPAGIALDYDHLGLFQKYVAPGFKLDYLIFVTNQWGDRKINVYGFGHKE
jgi:DNA-binding beta-propeller fold protein YncE